MTVNTRLIGGVPLALTLWSTFPLAFAGQHDDCAAERSLVVLSGQDTALLWGAPADQVSLYRASGPELVPIPFQIDFKDDQGRYLVDEPEGQAVDSNDELVFRASDVSDRWDRTGLRSGERQFTEIGLTDGAGWIYAGVSDNPERPSATAPMTYEPGSDQVTGPAYRMRFEAQLPFIVDSFQWRSAESGGWSQDITDRMKIRHRGRFLGLIPFQRTERDYVSRLTGVKAGPLRIIRRTENHIRMLWTLQSPAVYVDYVIMPHGFVMNTVIDIPFKVGLFFRDVETLTTMDWNSTPEPPRLKVHAPGSRQGLIINGHMSAEKEALNRIQASEFAVSSPLGKMFVELELPAGAPIIPWLYLRDDRDQPDPPEHEVGQFGNVGFRTTGWEDVEPHIQQLKFEVCLESAQ